jgi:AcrR family transcriptional regulator
MSLRRIPTQARSQKRVDAILEAAGRLFSDAGFEATSMEAIAEEAGTSIGSVYQYFGDKRAVFLAMAERCLEKSRAAFARTLGEDPASRSTFELIDAMIDTFAGLEHEDPAFRALWRNIQLYPEYASADQAMVREFIGVTAGLLAVRAKELPAARRPLVATMVVETIVAMLFLAAREGRGESAEILGEAKTMIHRYLAPWLDED